MTASSRERMINENCCSACVYEILKDRGSPREENPSFSHVKDKIARPHSKQFQSIVIDKYESTVFQGENPSLSHLLQLRKLRVSLMITAVTEKDGTAHRTTRAFC